MRKKAYSFRQGKISKWFAGIGQEAIALATMQWNQMRSSSPMHRNLGVFTTRKVPLENYLHNGKVKNLGLPKAEVVHFISAR
ncbi:MAG: hypothetical protein R2728_13200 [Chitinophagales bacterium]